MPAITYSGPIYFPSSTYPGGATWYQVGGTGPFLVMANGFTMMTTGVSAGTGSLTLMGNSTLSFTNSSIINLVAGNGIDCYGDLGATIGAGSSVKGYAAVQSYQRLTLDNAGMLEGAYAAVSAASLELYNTGVIRSVGTAVAIRVSGNDASHLRNYGTITADASDGDAISLAGGGDSLENFGSITGVVGFNEGSNNLENSGTINGYVNMGSSRDYVSNSGFIGSVYFGDGADQYLGYEGSYAEVAGGDGDDLFTLLGTATGYFYGEADNDTFNIGSRTDAPDIVIESANEGSDTIISTISRTLDDFANFENIELVGSRRVNATGNAAANALGGYGNAAANTLIGRGGNDTYYVDGLDIVDESVSGSSGTDTVVVHYAGSYSLTASTKGNVENITYDGTATTTAVLTGNGLANVLTSNGNSSLKKVTLKGLTGNDTYVVDNYATVDETGGTGTDKVRVVGTYSLSDTTKIKGSVEQIEWVGASTSSTTATLTGNGLNNALTASSAAKITLKGLSGNDSYTVGANAIVDEGGGAATDIDTVVSAFTVDLGNTARVKGTVENVTLTGASAINAIAANNTVANKLIGNIKANILDGKGGADMFVFNTAYGSGNVDTVKGFTHLSDEIQLDDAIFKALGTAVDAIELRKGAGFTTATTLDHHLIYNTTDGALRYDPDGNKAGGVAAVQIAILTDKPALDQTDFAII